MNFVFIKGINLKIVEVFIFLFTFIYNREMGIVDWAQSQIKFYIFIIKFK